MPEKIDALLINPISARLIPAFVPHGLLYIASFAINKGYKVAIYDRNVQRQQLEELLDELEPKVVGLGCLTGKPIDDAISVSRTIKKIRPEIKMVWGGIHTSLYPDSVLKKDFVDFVVVGDGEAAFAGILDNVIRGNLPIGSIDNLGYKEDGKLIYNKNSFTDMENLPQPAWHLIEVEKYITRKFYARRVITINTSRGCPYNCSFCCVPKVHRGQWRAVSAEKIIENLKFLALRYNIDGFQIDDDEFDIDRKRVLRLCGLLKSDNLNLKWSHFSRTNIANEETLKEESECGLKLIEFGVESGSPRMLEFLNKGQTVTQINRAYSICKKLGIKTNALFMVGLPTEAAPDLEQTVRLIKQLKPHFTICTIFKPYPGTAFFDYCAEKGLFRYPQGLEDVASIYSGDVNVSNVADKAIRKTKRYFDYNNIFQEISNSIASGNLGLIVYYLRYRLFNALSHMFKN